MYVHAYAYHENIRSPIQCLALICSAIRSSNLQFCGSQLQKAFQLLDCGETFSQSGFTALMMACQEGEADVVDTLLRAGATIDIKDQVSRYRGWIYYD